MNLKWYLQTNKNKKHLVRFTEEPLCLKCEWNCCHESFNSWQKFNIHLTEHATKESGKYSLLIIYFINIIKVVSTITITLCRSQNIPCTIVTKSTLFTKG